MVIHVILKNVTHFTTNRLYCAIPKYSLALG